jgi:hypothetical protein
MHTFDRSARDRPVMHFGRITDRRSGPFGGLERIRFGLSIREYAAETHHWGSLRAALR